MLYGSPLVTFLSPVILIHIRKSVINVVEENTVEFLHLRLLYLFQHFILFEQFIFHNNLMWPNIFYIHNIFASVTVNVNPIYRYSFNFKHKICVFCKLVVLLTVLYRLSGWKNHTSSNMIKEINIGTLCALLAMVYLCIIRYAISFLSKIYSSYVQWTFLNLAPIAGGYHTSNHTSISLYATFPDIAFYVCNRRQIAVPLSLNSSFTRSEYMCTTECL